MRFMRNFYGIFIIVLKKISRSHWALRFIVFFFRISSHWNVGDCWNLNFLRPANTSLFILLINFRNSILWFKLFTYFLFSISKIHMLILLAYLCFFVHVEVVKLWKVEVFKRNDARIVFVLLLVSNVT